METTKRDPIIMSKIKPIHSKNYGENPFLEDFKKDYRLKRQVAHEEACRDLDKSPEQILVDIHDESLASIEERLPHETISRAIARLASMQLRVEAQSRRTNCILFWMSVIGFPIAIVGTVASVIQAWYSAYPPH